MRIMAAVFAILLLGGCAVERMAALGDTGGEAGNGGIAAGGAPSTGGTGGVGGASDGGAGKNGAGCAAGNEDPTLPEPRCTAEEIARAEKPLPAGSGPFGFTGLQVGGEPAEATVVGISSDSVRFRLDTGEQGSFGWPGPLPLDIADGSRVRLASRNYWAVLVSEAGSLAVLRYAGLGGPPRAAFPGEHTETMFATQCFFAPPEWSNDFDDCSRRVPPSVLLSVVGGSKPLGSIRPTVIGSGKSGSGGAWMIQNHRIIYLPGYSDDTCIVEGESTVLLTAYTPYAEAAPF